MKHTTTFPILHRARAATLCGMLAAALLAGCGKGGGDTPAPRADTPATTPAAGGSHPSAPTNGQASEPMTPAPAPGSGEGASAATDPSTSRK